MSFAPKLLEEPGEPLVEAPRLSNQQTSDIRLRLVERHVVSEDSRRAEARCPAERQPRRHIPLRTSPVAAEDSVALPLGEQCQPVRDAANAARLCPLRQRRKLIVELLAPPHKHLDRVAGRLRRQAFFRRQALAGEQLAGRRIVDDAQRRAALDHKAQ